MTEPAPSKPQRKMMMLGQHSLWLVAATMFALYLVVFLIVAAAR